LKNILITFEGIDGCGKSTQINLLSKYLNNIKMLNSIIREPGGTDISEKIREILLNNNNLIEANAETLLFLSARAQLVNEIMSKSKNILLCDRYIDSTLAYQGYGRNQDIDLINKMNLFATNNIVPDLTVIFDIDPQIVCKRNNKNLDRMEKFGIDFQNEIRRGYLKIANQNQKRCHIIDCGEKDIRNIHLEVVKVVELYLRRKKWDLCFFIALFSCH